MPALHLILFYFTLYVTFGYSISLIRDPARGSSQLYLHVAWTSTFKQFFQKWLIPVFAHSDSVGSHPSYIAPWYLTFRSRCDLYYFWENFPKWRPSICTDPPTPQGESLARLAARWGREEGWLGLRDGWHLRQREHDDLFWFLFQGYWNFVKLSRILGCFQM